MKITKTAEQAEKERIAFISPREKANIGCNHCPFCKADVMVLYQGQKAWRDLSSGRTCWADMYRCSQCGAEWESDPYVPITDPREKFFWEHKKSNAELEI